MGWPEPQSSYLEFFIAGITGPHYYAQFFVEVGSCELSFFSPTRPQSQSSLAQLPRSQLELQARATGARFIFCSLEEVKDH
jgi:hypothetical protein